MFIFCLCDVVYWISVKIRVNTAQKVKRKNMLPKYVGSFTAEVRTAFLCHRFEVSSRSFERVFIRLLMSEVSSDSKVKHIHNQPFCKRYFF